MSLKALREKHACGARTTPIRQPCSTPPGHAKGKATKPPRAHTNSKVCARYAQRAGGCASQQALCCPWAGCVRQEPLHRCPHGKLHLHNVAGCDGRHHRRDAEAELQWPGLRRTRHIARPVVIAEGCTASSRPTGRRGNPQNRRARGGAGQGRRTHRVVPGRNGEDDAKGLCLDRGRGGLAEQR